MHQWPKSPQCQTCLMFVHICPFATIFALEVVVEVTPLSIIASLVSCGWTVCSFKCVAASVAHLHSPMSTSLHPLSLSNPLSLNHTQSPTLVISCIYHSTLVFVWLVVLIHGLLHFVFSLHHTCGKDHLHRTCVLWALGRPHITGRP